VPDLQRIAIVGDRWEKQTAYRHLQEQIPTTSSALEIIDLVGLPMRELKKRVAVLPERTAIAYTSIFSDGEGTSYPPVDALRIFAEVANQPIVVAAETFVGSGAVGGYVLTPTAIGVGRPLIWRFAYLMAKARRQFPLATVTSSGHSSIGGKCSGGGSARQAFLPGVKSAFATQLYGSNTSPKS